MNAKWKPGDIDTRLATGTLPGRGEGTPEGAFARAGRAADPDPYSVEPVGGNWSNHHLITDGHQMPVTYDGNFWQLPIEILNRHQSS